MIKKSTKIVFEESGKKTTEDMKGGIPLSIGETVIVKRGAVSTEYEVADKRTEISYSNEDVIVDTTHFLKKK